MATKRVKSDSTEHLLEVLWDAKGTDLHLAADAPALIRVDGDLRPVNNDVLTAADVTATVRGMVNAEQWEAFERDQDLDFSFNWRDQARFRGNAFLQRGVMSLALRLIPNEIPTFDDLGLPEVIRRFVDLRQGFILVTGPTGSGKSTTLASIIDQINIDRRCHILTIEDPIEYVHDHKNSAVNQREVGSDSVSFDQALRSALREDPDVLLVGEMRDLESIQTALTIAETGHLVFATLHTNDTAPALDRVVDVLPADRHQQIRVQLAASLAGVIYQRLLPVVGGGMVAAFEVMIANNAVRNLVREGKNRQLRNVVATHVQEGMQTLEQSLTMLVKEGVVEYETALGASLYPKEVERPVPVLVPV